MRVIDAQAIARLTTYNDFVEAMRHGFASRIEAPLRHHHQIARNGLPEATLLLMPAWSNMGSSRSENRFIGLKLVTIFPENPEKELPSIQGSYVLISGESGTPIAVIDGTELTLRRTASASALAATYLAREDAEILVMVGAGALSRHLVCAHAAVRPVRRVLVWNRNPDKARALVERLQADGFDAETTSELEPAVRQADIVSCGTMSADPLVRGAWLKPGAHVDLVGAFKPTLRESDDEVMRRGAVYVDTRDGALAEAGDVIQAIAAGALSVSEIRADLFELCRGEKPGRRDENEITVFKSVGTALEDLAAAIMLYERATL